LCIEKIKEGIFPWKGELEEAWRVLREERKEFKEE
jgi:hypothetical protein